MKTDQATSGPATKFSIDPKKYGLPDLQQLKDFRMWDSHYHAFLSPENLVSDHEEMMFYVKRMGVERVIALDVGGERLKPLIPTTYDKQMRDLVEKESEYLSGITRIDPSDPVKSCAKMEEWIQNGPCIGIKYQGRSETGVTCDHPSNDPIIRLAAELDAIIYIHTWIKTGGTIRYPGGGNNAGESTPMHVAALAKRFPDVPMICGHAGGDWELGVRAIRAHENVFLEFAGADPNSGSVDFAVNELGADRIVWGGHGPTRSYSTEISKVLDASVSNADRMKIFGGNYRRIAAPIFRKKNMPIEI